MCASSSKRRGRIRSPKWSPDGKQIAYVTYDGQPFFYYANRYIAVVTADGGAPKVLTRDFDEDANLIDWGPDGIYFTALQKTNAHIFRMDPATGAIHRLTAARRISRRRRLFHQRSPRLRRNRRRA